MNYPRTQQLNILKTTSRWDVIVIGGGASGLGVALDAVSRGLKTLVVERADFGSGTSGKSTKLAHGGVRYLAQGSWKLVREALQERKYMMEKAAHLCVARKFIIPVYDWFHLIKYFVGLKIYDILAGSNNLNSSRWMTKAQVLSALPRLKQSGLLGGIGYEDGSFDDSRLCIDLVTTIHHHGGLCINYMPFTGLIHFNGKVDGIHLQDVTNGLEYTAHSGLVVNATGVEAGNLMLKEHIKEKYVIRSSKGSHIVLKSDINTGFGMMIPSTADGRVIFAIPWKGKLLVGTTDVSPDKGTAPLMPSPDEVNYLLSHLNAYFDPPFVEGDISASFSGLRPLVSLVDDKRHTLEVSRHHKVVIAPTGLVSIIGGKWTIFRKMGMDTLNAASEAALLDCMPSTSAQLQITPSFTFSQSDYIHPELPYSLADIKQILEQEYVVTLDDLVSRRTSCTSISTLATQEVMPVLTRLFEDFKTNGS
ncbi:MAG: glycerol-3-phosphate dehydrogenase/oxidase [Saprospiraceae bacterium]|nr:glycerol-3-phosphate dehydrogenase/oxidase [Saprospiraceae bacterium]